MLDNNALRPAEPTNDVSTLTVCELYAGLATCASLMAAEYGWRVTMLCECAELLLGLLRHKFPAATFSSNVNKKPWIQWAAAGLSVVLIFAGVACQPFSDAGMLRQQDDARAWQALLVLEAAVALKALYVVLENVTNFVDKDVDHGVFTKVVEAFDKAGYDLKTVLRPRHSECGGQTSRDRVLVVFVQRGAPSSQSECWQAVTAAGANTQADVCAHPSTELLSTWDSGRLGDPRRNWLLYGSREDVRQTGRRNPFTTPAFCLKFDSDELVPGAVVTVKGSSIRWRLQAVEASTLHLRNVDRRVSTLLQVTWTQVEEVLRCADSCYDVYSPDAIMPAIRAWGEPPGRGAALVETGGQVRTLSLEARWKLQEGDPADLVFLQNTGATFDQMASAIGNSIPPSMLRGLLNAVHADQQERGLLRTVPTTGGDSRNDTDKVQLQGVKRQRAADTLRRFEPHRRRFDPSADPLVRLNDVACATSAGPVLRAQTCGLPVHVAKSCYLSSIARKMVRILCIAVCAREVPMTVQLTALGEPLCADVSEDKAGTGRMLLAVKDHCSGATAFLAGQCNLGQQFRVWVVAVLATRGAPVWALHSSDFTQKGLADSPLYPAVSLVIAKVASMQSGYTTKADLDILLGQHGQQALAPTVGKTVAKKMSPATIASECKTMTRAEILEQSRHTEQWIAQILASAASALSDTDSSLAAYLEDWSGQVTTTDLRDVPDALLSQIPTFVDPLLASLPFNDKFCPQETSRVLVPDMRQQNAGRPRNFAELLVPDAFRAKEEAEAEFKEYLQLMHSGAASEHELIALRPRPRYFGQDAVMPDYRGCVWDTRSSPFKPLDMVTTLNTHLNLKFWNKHMRGNKDEQLKQFMNDGVSTGSRLDLQCCLNPPLISLGDGILDMEKDCDRVIQEDYLEEHAGLPFWPCRGGSVGTRPKKDTHRRITDVETPRHPAVDSEGIFVQGGNSATKATLPLPRESKGMQQDVLNDECILRYIGDLLGWTLVLVSDDFKDFFYQIRLHPSELWKGVFALLDTAGEEYRYLVERVMGMGYWHTSNVAQRFGNTVIQIVLKEFDKLDAPFLEEEASRLPVLRAWLEHRGKLQANAVWNQARLAAASLYTDDSFFMVLVPPDGQRLVRFLSVWHRVTGELRIRMAAPAKRMIGVAVPYTGVLHLSLLGLEVIPRDKTQRGMLKLVEACSGKMLLEDYEKLVGLLGFIRFVLKLKHSTMSVCYEPLKDKYDASKGPGSRVLNTVRRVKVWHAWIDRLLSVHGAPATVVLPDAPPAEPSVRQLVWSGDAAMEGTKYPGMCGYAHGAFWVFKLRKRHLAAMHITAWEFMTIIGNFMIFGALAPKQRLELLIQTDSLVSALVLNKEAAKSPIMVYLMDVLMGRPEFDRVKECVTIGHAWGEGNPLADNGSRGDLVTLVNTCEQLGVKATRVEVPAAFVNVIEAAVQFAEQLKAEVRAP
jgi:site-specific DNA-cytosine methylase